MTYKAKKGDVVAVELRHSSTYVHGRTERSSTWHLGRVGSATRDGSVKTAIVVEPTESGRPFERVCHEYDRNRGYGWAAHTISTDELRQAAATLPPAVFNSADELRAAIMAAAG